MVHYTPHLGYDPLRNQLLCSEWFSDLLKAHYMMAGRGGVTDEKDRHIEAVQLMLH